MSARIAPRIGLAMDRPLYSSRPLYSNMMVTKIATRNSVLTTV